MDTALARLDRLGVTVGILRYENRVQLCRELAHGTVIPTDTPEYPTEVAAQQSFLLLKEWKEQTGTACLRTVTGWASIQATIGRLARWPTGVKMETCPMESASA